MKKVKLKSIAELEKLGCVVTVMPGNEQDPRTFVSVETKLGANGKPPAWTPSGVNLILNKDEPIYVINRKANQHIESHILETFSQLFEELPE